MMMRLLRFVPLLLTILLVWLLSTGHGILPPLGAFLDPVNGAMAAAEPADQDFTENLKIKGLQQNVVISLEDRLVPHITAQNDHDLYFAQGYVHARFRLWQMDMQTRAAAGRVSEVAGKKAFRFDQGQRRKGMGYAAERSLRAMEAEPRTKTMLDAYTAGINVWIRSLSYREFPLEYKLMNFRPEPWTNMKSALLLKYMADDLTGTSDDIAFTLLRDQLGQEQFDFLFPERIRDSQPVIPAGTLFGAPSLQSPRYPGDSIWTHFSVNKTAAIPAQNAESQSGIGSNNWAVSGKYTATGAPILCNDPHLGLNLPSLWFEVQLTAPGINTYGASLPGAPGVVIGFNENISWGFTNNYRDVKDYYTITADNRETYLFNHAQVAFQKRPEQIVIRDSADVIDTVLYTVHGPVQYEPRFPDPAKTGRMLAMCWMAHRPTNELLALYLVNRADNYDHFTAGIRHFECPAQNFAYADKAGNIAMWGQGQFINKWRGQGKYVMEGRDSLTLWGQDIPMDENPHVLNPEQGYVVSANQSVTDSTYPYWYNGSFTEFRSWRINQMLTVPFTAALFKDGANHRDDQQDMGSMQNDLHSVLAEKMAPLFERFTQLSLTKDTSGAGLRKNSSAFGTVNLSATSIEATQFQIWWALLYKDIWQDDFPYSGLYPSAERTMQLLLQDTASRYYDDRRTSSVETFRDIVQQAGREMKDSMDKLRSGAGAEWYRVKNTSLTHLAKIPAFSWQQLKTGGWGNTINAMKQNHGPSWRMMVSMEKNIRAYGVYPGGQSGNPGSIHYGDNIDKWVAGQYYELKFTTATSPETNFKYKLTLQPAL